MTSPFQRVAKAIASDLPSFSASEADTLIGLLRQGQPQPPFPGYPVNVDYSASLEQLVKAGKYDWFNDDITGRNFPSSEKGTAQVLVYLVNFNRDINSEDVVKELDRQGLRPATLKELLALGASYPDLQRKDLIVSSVGNWFSLFSIRLLVDVLKTLYSGKLTQPKKSIPDASVLILTLLG